MYCPVVQCFGRYTSETGKIASGADGKVARAIKKCTSDDCGDGSSAYASMTPNESATCHLGVRNIVVAPCAFH